MPTPSRYLGLAVPNRDDQFSTADVAENWGKIDKAPGTYICTSTTRPTFGSSQEGRRIYETDTDLEWIWTGTAFRRIAPKGLLKKTNGEWAVGTRTTDFASSSSTYAVVMSVTDVVVPPGNRTLMIQANWSRAYNTLGYFYGSIFRSAQPHTGTRIAGLAITGAQRSGINPDEGGGGTLYGLERGGLAPGVYSWSFQIATNASIGGMSTVQGNAEYPNLISVVEL